MGEVGEGDGLEIIILQVNHFLMFGLVCGAEEADKGSPSYVTYHQTSH